MKQSVQFILFVLVGGLALSCAASAQPKADSSTWKPFRPYVTRIFDAGSGCSGWKVISFLEDEQGDSCAVVQSEIIDPEYPVCDGTNGLSGRDCLEAGKRPLHTFQDAIYSPFVSDPMHPGKVHIDYPNGECGNNDKFVGWKVRFYRNDTAPFPMVVLDQMWMEKTIDRFLPPDDSHVRPYCRPVDHSGILRYNGDRWLIEDCLAGLDPPWGSCFPSKESREKAIAGYQRLQDCFERCKGVARESKESCLASC